MVCTKEMSLAFLIRFFSCAQCFVKNNIAQRESSTFIAILNLAVTIVILHLLATLFCFSIFQFNISLAHGFGVSLINSLQEEIIFATFSRIQLDYLSVRKNISVELVVGNIQVNLIKLSSSLTAFIKLSSFLLKM